MPILSFESKIIGLGPSWAVTIYREGTIVPQSGINTPQTDVFITVSVSTVGPTHIWTYKSGPMRTEGIHTECVRTEIDVKNASCLASLLAKGGARLMFHEDGELSMFSL